MQTQRIRLTDARAALLALAVGLSALSCPSCKKQATPPVAGKEDQATEDAGYVAALATANAFCRAWQNKDWGAAKKLFTPELLERYPAQRLVNAVIGAANHEHTAYEVFDGRRLGDGRYEFQLRLYVRYAGKWQDRSRAHRERVVLAREAGGAWRVDEIPVP